MTALKSIAIAVGVLTIAGSSCHRQSPVVTVTAKSHLPDELEYSAQIERKFLSETPDPGWSRGAVEEVTRALSSDLTQGSRLGKVECRTSLCRVDTSHDNLPAYQLFVRTAFLSATRKLWGGGLNTLVRSQSPAGLAAVTFIAKDGQAVPPPELVMN